MTKVVLCFPRIKFTKYFPCKQIIDICCNISKRQELNALEVM